jgi:hypothetical protein
MIMGPDGWRPLSFLTKSVVKTPSLGKGLWLPMSVTNLKRKSSLTFGESQAFDDFIFKVLPMFLINSSISPHARESSSKL